MKKMLIIPLLFISCGKLKQRQITFNNPTDTDLRIESETLKGFTVYSQTSEMVLGYDGVISYNVHSKAYLTNYSESVTVNGSDINVILHK